MKISWARRVTIDQARYSMLSCSCNLTSCLTENTTSVLKTKHGDKSWKYVHPHVACLLFSYDCHENRDVETDFNKNSKYEIWRKQIRLVGSRCYMQSCKRDESIVKKEKCSIVQALRLCTGRAAHRGSRGKALLFLDHSTRRGERSASRSDRSLRPGKTRYPLHRRLGGPLDRSGQVRKISSPPEFDPRTVQPVTSH